ncbi:MAG: LysM peptidoglycan-binding domain-containing protein [Planctomycetota bacterium]|nr:LysM peptidoglycan-binding domain-containing protein [Planctomycetota bacterium]
MRKDVKLGLAVGGILFGAVLVYVLFFAGGSANKGRTDQAVGPVGPASGDTTAKGMVPSPAQGETSIGVDTTKVGSESVAIGGPTIRPGDVGSGTSRLTGNVSGSAQTPTGTEGVGTETAANTGGWDWRQALDRGASNELISHSVTPGGVTGGMARGGERTGETSWRNAFSRMEPPTTRPVGSARMYVVKPGDTLWSIAKAEYGSANFFPHLARANPKVDASRLQAGSCLMIPGKDEVVPANAAAVLSPTTQPVDPGKQYRVQAGDNLNTICRRLYGSTVSVSKLYQLNKDVIGPNPSALKLNMVLQLPEAPSNRGTGSVVPAAGPVAGSMQ